MYSLVACTSLQTCLGVTSQGKMMRKWLVVFSNWRYMEKVVFRSFSSWAIS